MTILDELRAALEERFDHPRDTTFVEWAGVVDAIADFAAEPPSIVEVARCGECQSHDHGWCDRGPGGASGPFPSDFYCANGQRKEAP